jgi:hypothetical protein
MRDSDFQGTGRQDWQLDLTYMPRGVAKIISRVDLDLVWTGNQLEDALATHYANHDKSCQSSSWGPEPNILV